MDIFWRCRPPVFVFIEMRMKYLGLTLSLALLLSKAYGQTTTSREELELQLREPVPASSDPTALKIVSTFRQSLTGSEDVDAGRSLYRQGTRREGVKGGSLSEYWIHPDQWRIEQVDEDDRKGQALIRGWGPDGGWEYDLRAERPFPKSLPPEGLSGILREHDPLGWLLAKEWNRYIFEYGGEVRSQKRPHYLVRAYLPSGRTLYYYFDQETLMLTRINEQKIIGLSVIDMDTFITRYDKIDRQWVEKEWELHMGGRPFGKTVWETITVNPAIDDSLFLIPEVEEFWLRQQ